MTLLTALKLVSKHSRSLQKEWNSAKKMSMPCSASLSVVAKRRFSTLVVMSSKNSSPNEGDRFDHLYLVRLFSVIKLI